MTVRSVGESPRISGNPFVLESWDVWAGALDCGYTARVWQARDLRKLADALVARLSFRQIPPGAPVIFMLANTAAFPVALMALLQKGCNPLLVFAGTPLPSLQRVAAEFGVRFAIHDFIDGVSALEPSALTVLDHIEIGPMAMALLDTGNRDYPVAPVAGEGVVLHPTSGTSGAARFCLRNQTTAMAEARSYLETMDFYRGIRVTFTTPLSHGYGYGFGLLAAVLSHSTLAVDATFNPKRILRLERERPSDIIAIVPPMAKALLDVNGRDPGPRLAAAVFYSGARIDPRLAEAFETALATTLYTNWGTTETGPITTTFARSGVLAGVGLPLRGVEVETIDEPAYAGLGAGIGELQVRSPALMQGYVPGADPARPVTQFPTGDIGSIDDDGCVHLIARARDIVNIGGNKVDPSDVEAVILSYPAVDDVAVYPGIGKDGFEFVQAAVVGAGIDIRLLRSFCLAELAGYKVPTVFHIVDEIPRTPSGKPIKVRCPDYPDRLMVAAKEA